MMALRRKFETVRRVIRYQGPAGLASAVGRRLDIVGRVVRPPVAYARLAPSVIPMLARHGRPHLCIAAVGAGIGDDLLCTTILRELRRRGRPSAWMMTRHPELFGLNRDVGVVVPPLDRYDTLLRHLGADVVTPWYTSYNPVFDRDEPMPEQHIIAVMCQKAGITGEVALRPYLALTPQEVAAGHLAPAQIAIQSAGLDARHAMANKNWSRDGYQRVVDALRARFQFVQLGSTNDPPLDGALDLRGGTTLRQTAAVLAASRAFVGQVGLLMHLARAVDRASVIVYGGRETPVQSGYPCNENLYSAVPCSPCWRLNSCPHERMCLSMISADAVVDAIERLLVREHVRGDAPLETDRANITPAMVARNARRHASAVDSHRQGWQVLHC